MAYNTKNYLKKIERIRAVYNSVKESDKPDTYIVSKIFPKHDINISYSSWMFMKHYGKEQAANSN